MKHLRSCHIINVLSYNLSVAVFSPASHEFSIPTHATVRPGSAFVDMSPVKEWTVTEVHLPVSY